MLSITYRIPFDAGHRILGHGGKCKHLHGHSYVVELAVEHVSPELAIPDQLDDLGMLVDFGVIKDKIKTWVDKNWDHNFLLHFRDPLIELHQLLDKSRIDAIFGCKPPYIMEYGNPTAENMARELGKIADELLKEHYVRVRLVTVHETENCKATYSPHH